MNQGEIRLYTNRCDSALSFAYNVHSLPGSPIHPFVQSFHFNLFFLFSASSFFILLKKNNFFYDQIHNLVISSLYKLINPFLITNHFFQWFFFSNWFVLLSSNHHRLPPFIFKNIWWYIVFLFLFAPFNWVRRLVKSVFPFWISTTFLNYFTDIF